MESIKDALTNEKLRIRFGSQFELVNYAIKLAENMIRTGRGPRIKTDVQNLAMQILEEIVAGKDQFEELPIESIDAIEKTLAISSREQREEAPAPRQAERKKPRKILAE